jgi:hypothetical protein
MNEKNRYWHSLSRGIHGDLFQHNAKLMKGEFVTGGAGIYKIPEGAILSPYTSFNAHQEKEDYWEEIRKSCYPNLPSRRGCLFLFDNERDFDVAVNLWWANEERIKLCVEVIDAKLCKADTKWLDANAQD